MKIPHKRKRDNQQWLLDWVVNQSGRVINYEYEERELPDNVKTYAQVPKALGRRADYKASIAEKARLSGHRRTALFTYQEAIFDYIQAQHAIFEDDHPVKLKYHSKLLRCFDALIDVADYPIERVEIPWEGKEIQANFHFIPGKPNAPCVIVLPGMDVTKEFHREPIDHTFTSRGMHAIVIDGPGQGTSNIRKIRINDDNYEQAVSAVIDWLVDRPEVDSTKIALHGQSMGSHWAVRAAAYDHRIKATAASMSCLGDKIGLFEQSSPRFKQIFMYMAGIQDENEFDIMAAKMNTLGYGKKIKTPFLIMTGEYDPLSPLESAEQFFDELVGPKELWVLEDYYHLIVKPPHFGGILQFNAKADWIRDALDGKFDHEHRRYVYISKSGLGQYSPETEGRVSVDPDLKPGY